ASFPLNAFEPAFAELADAMADLEANMMHFQLMHESLARFSEDFASFLYGLNMNAFCVDFPEGPLTESFKRMREKEEREVAAGGGAGSGQQGQNMETAATTVKQDREGFDGETTFIGAQDTRSKTVEGACAVWNDKRHEWKRCWPWCYARFSNDEPRCDY
ncbi:DASH complex subunit dam1, partial [Neurospora sp. IMI 360204]